jgi:hypothetical protein
LNALAAADIVKACGGFVILLIREKVGMESKIFLQLVETILWLRARQQLLPNRTKQLDDIRTDKSGHFCANRIIGWPVAAEKLRPGAGVYDHSHGFQTCCVADFQIGGTAFAGLPAGWEARDTADLEVCATGPTAWRTVPPTENVEEPPFIVFLSIQGWLSLYLHVPAFFSCQIRRRTLIRKSKMLQSTP